MISLRSVTKTFGAKVAVDKLTLHVAQGELFAFLGPNGAGKTTTIKMLAGLLKPDAGTIEIAGIDVAQDHVSAKAKLSYVPDEPFLYEKLSGRELLRFVGEMYGMDRKRIASGTAELADAFELNEFLDDLCESYSHGMKQRVVLTAALLHEPEVLLVDEPMVGLDPKGARLVKRILRERVEAGAAVLMSTHTLDVAEEVADRIGIINNGRLVATGTLEELAGVAETDGRLEEAFLRITDPDQEVVA